MLNAPDFVKHVKQPSLTSFFGATIEILHFENKIRELSLLQIYEEQPPGHLAWPQSSRISRVIFNKDVSEGYFRQNNNPGAILVEAAS